MTYRLSLPEGQFGTVYADPPWMLTPAGRQPARRPLHYDRMPTEDIKAIPVGDVTHGDAHLWLWTTNAHLPEAMDVIRAWGFTYKSCLTWAKDRMGTGWWLRGKTEHVLLAVKSGNLRSNPGNITTLLEAKVRAHSQKPDEVYPLIERLSPGPYLELFARADDVSRPNWTRLSSPGAPRNPYGDGPAGSFAAFAAVSHAQDGE